MKIALNVLIATTLIFPSLLYAQELTPDGIDSGDKVLFIYDKIDKGSRFYVDAFKRELSQKVRIVEESAVAGTPSAADASGFRNIVIYSRVMAFNMMFPVRKWIKKQKSLKDKRIFLYVTSGGIGHEANLKSLLKVVKEKNGTVVDAVTMATTKMTEEQKQAAIAKHLEKLTR